MNIKKLFAGLAAIAALASCQKAADPFMTLSQQNLTVDAEGGKYTFKVSANVYYRVNNDIKWATVTKGVEAGDSTEFTLDVEENTAFTSRSEYVRFIGDYVTPLRLHVTQKAAVPVGIDPQEMELLYTATQAQFTVLGDKAWTISCDNSNVQLSPSSGTGETLVTATFPANKSEDAVVYNLTMNMAGKTYTAKITHKGNASADLSEKATANCYIVSAAGPYKFKAVRGTGIVPESLAGRFGDLVVESAKLLWSSYNTSVVPTEDLIQDVSVEKGYIKFFVPEGFKYGNAVIAGLDKDGKIVWSWHIWLTEKPGDIVLAHGTWMDRNLGATEAPVAGQVLPATTSGFFYSWGRKDPFRPVSDFETEEHIATRNAEGCEWKADVKSFVNTYPIDRFIAEPMTYFEDTKKFWVDTDGETKLTDLWLGTKKTMFDPCPPGYRIPRNEDDTNLAADTNVINKDKAAYAACHSATNHSFTFGSVIFPLGGAYVFNTAGVCSTVGNCGRYCAAEYASGTNTYWININASSFNVNNTGACCQGGMVRCIKE